MRRESGGVSLYTKMMEFILGYNTINGRGKQFLAQLFPILLIYISGQIHHGIKPHIYIDVYVSELKIWRKKLLKITKSQ